MEAGAKTAKNAKEFRQARTNEAPSERGTIGSTPRGRWFFAAACVFVVSSFWAWLQPARTVPHAVLPQGRAAMLQPAWWLYPRENTPLLGLQVITGDLNAIYAAPDRESIWVVGNSGMIAVSRD